MYFGIADDFGIVGDFSIMILMNSNQYPLRYLPSVASSRIER